MVKPNVKKRKFEGIKDRHWWSDQELALLTQLILKYGKNYSKISQEMKTKDRN